MTRPLRVQFPGAWYHVTSRGNEGRAVFKSREDRKRFLSYLQSAHERYGAAIHVYCLMTNHYHLLVETPRSNLSQILHHINGAYTNYYNARRRRSGHLFQGRYKAIVVEADAYCQELSRYMHLNPVRAGITQKPSEYRWSSYSCYVGLSKKPEWLIMDRVLGYFDKDKSRAQSRYRGFVENAIGRKTKSPLMEIYASTFLGSEKFITWAKENWIGLKNADTRNIPVLKELKERALLEEIERAVHFVASREDPLFKKLCLHASQEYSGYSLKEIGAYYKMRGSAVSQSNRRFQRRVSKDKELKNVLAELKRMLKVET